MSHLLVGSCVAGLVAISAWVLSPSVKPPTDVQTVRQGTGEPEPSATAKRVVSKQDVLADKRPRFGLSAPQVPFSTAEINRLGGQAGKPPSLLQYFTKWTENFRPEAMEASYKLGALPLISWEPWAGKKAGDNQPTYSLKSIASGAHDVYVKEFASGIKRDGRPVALRLAHEMNGHWYPWSETRSGNARGDFVRAWQHVHDVFGQVGATNVIWVWSPNIIRAVPSVNLAPLYPGDSYVDWIGMVGYAVGESTAAAVFEPTIKKLRAFTQLPILITETGAENGAKKAAWIKDFMAWIGSRGDMVGFIWFEFSKEEGGSSDWRFTKDPQYVEAFRAGLAKLDLAGPPTAGG